MVNRIRKFSVVSLAFSFWLAILVYAWGIISPETSFTADRYLFGWIIGEFALIYHYTDIQIFKGILSIERLPVVTKSLNATVLVAIIASVIGISIMQQSPLGFVQLFSISDPQGNILLVMPLALFVVGYVMPAIEESSLFGSMIRPSINETLEQFGTNKLASLTLSFVSSAILFGLFHLLISKIVFDLFVMAFLIRIILDIGNIYFGHLFGFIVHSFINSFIVGVAIFGMGMVSWWLIPPFLVIAPFYVFPRWSHTI